MVAPKRAKNRPGLALTKVREELLYRALNFDLDCPAAASDTRRLELLRPVLPALATLSSRYPMYIDAVPEKTNSVRKMVLPAVAMRTLSNTDPPMEPLPPHRMHFFGQGTLSRVRLKINKEIWSRMVESGHSGGCFQTSRAHRTGFVASEFEWTRWARRTILSSLQRPQAHRYRTHYEQIWRRHPLPPSNVDGH